MRFILLLFITLFISFITSSDSSSSSSLPHPDIHPDTTSHHPDIHLRIGTFHLNDALLTSHHTLSTTSSSHPINIGNLQLELHTPWHIQQQISQRHVMSVEDEVATDQEQAEEPDLWFLTLKAPILASTLDHIKRILSPSTLGTYVPYNTYIIHAPLSHVIRLTPESIPGLLYIHRMHPVCKIDPDLKERLLTYLTRRHELSQDITSLNATQHAHLRVTWAYDATSPTLSHLLHEWHDLWQQQHQHHLLSYHYHIVDGSQLRITVPHEDIMKMSDISILLQKLYDTRTPTSTPSTSIDTLLSHLLSHPSLTWIESDNLFTIHNKFSRYVVQSDLPETDPTAATMYLHGIHGENEIIAVGDTGVDHDNCYFHDPKVVTPVNIVDTLHRKIITYVTSPMNGGTGPLGPDGDEVGHGSHTAGTLVGSVMDNGRGMNPDLKTLALYNGIANASKLAIYDFQNPGEDSLYLPNLIYEDYFKPANDIGARICSNSWGDDSGDYDSYTRDVDRFMVDYPDFLAVFAAGNAGTSGVNGLTSLSTPAVAKNVLTVGSSYNSEASWAELGYNAGVTIAEPKAVSGTFFVATADYGPSYSVQQKTSAEAIMANPENACSDLTNDVDVRGKVVIVRRGICSFVTKSNNVQKAGGIMMLLITNTAEAPVIMYPGTTPPDSITATTITIPSIMIGQNDGEKLIPYINTLKIHFPSTAGKDLNEMRMSDFSSRGPTKDGRLKPDLITPGEHIQSAKSDKDVHTYQCQNKQTNVEIMEGTSMATPLAAASATLVRQYLREGHYYNHATKSIDVYTSPSSALLKAILIQSAQPIGGSVMGSKKDVAEKFDVTPVPSYFQGHGRVQLNTVVTFDENDQFHTILQDKQSIEQNQVQRTCVKMKSAPLNFTLRATLVWTDPAGMPASAMLLVNNLDLSIDGPMKNDTGSFNTAWLGNNNVDDVTLPPAKRSNGPQQQWDTSNNVEKIIIPTRQLMSDGTYAIGVRGTSIPTARQFYALVITGEFDVVDCPLEHYCPNNCFNHGICDESHCICDYHYAGADCSQSTIAISGSGTPIELTSATNQWVYYHYDTDGYETSLTWRMQSDGKGDPDFYLLFNGYPTLSNFTASNTDCDTCGKTDHTMIVPNETLTKFGAGTWTLGVWGYCCRDTWVKLWLEIQSRPRPATEAPTTKVPTTEAPTTLPPVVSSTAESSTGTSSTGSSGGDASSSPSPSTSTSTSSSTGPYYNISSQAYRFHLTFTTDINITHVIPSLCTIISFSCTRLLRSGYGDRDIYLTLLPPSPSNNSIIEKNEMNNDMIITKIQTMYTDIQKQPSPFNMLDISQPLIPQTYTVYWCPPWGITCTESSGTEPIINTTPTSDKPEVTWFGLNRNFLIAVVVGISVLCLTVMCCVCIHRKRRVEASGGAHHRVVTSQAPKVITTRTSRAASSPKKQHLPPVAMISSNPQDDTVLSDGEDVDDQQTFVVGGGGGGGEDELMSESDLEGAHAQPHPHIGTAEIQIGVDSERE